MPRITPCLWFDSAAEEAAAFYGDIFKTATIVDRMERTGTKTVLTITIELAGQRLILLNGGPHFQFTPAISMFVDCATQEEVDWYWGRLLDGGEASRCGWLKDRYGVSWQIVPTVLGRLLKDGDPQRAGRVFQAMLGMVKLDVAALERAYNGP